MDISAKEEYRDKKRFVYGESMGGAVALLIHKKDPAFWHGAVLVAPMCKVREYFRIAYTLSILMYLVRIMINKVKWLESLF